MAKNIDDTLLEYVKKFGELPPLPYGCDYDDEPVLKAIEKAIKTGEKTTFDDFEDIEERVITN